MLLKPAMHVARINQCLHKYEKSERRVFASFCSTNNNTYEAQLMSEQNFQADPNMPAAGASTLDAATMSTPETLTTIFFEPGRVFESLRARPRFLVAALITLVLTMLVTIILFQKVDFDQFMRDRISESPNGGQMTEEKMDRAVKLGKITAKVAPPFAVIAIFAAGAGLYLLGVIAMGGKMTYKQALSVWTYSSFAPGVLMTIISLLLLFLRPADAIDLTRPGGGLLVTNPGAFLGSGTSPMLVAALSSFDLFTFYGLFLAAIGLRKVGKLSNGSAWAIVIAFWALGLIFHVCRAALFGRTS